MSLTSLDLCHFRNMAELSLTTHTAVNLIYGANGSGKTSILEAIYYLSHGRSFRTSKSQRLIKDEQPALMLHAKVQAHGQLHRLGISRDRQAEMILRLNGQPINRLAEFASLLPVQLITPDSFKLFFGGPKERRQFFDMGVFHVEHTFFDIWLRFSKILKHRNALLKTSRHYDQQFQYWDQQYVELALALQQHRQHYIEQLAAAFVLLTQQTTLFADIQFQLQAGWPEKIQQPEELLELLQQSFFQDSKTGFTQYGPQKADLKLRKGGAATEEVLSRGQLKVLLFALKIAQNNVICNSGLKEPILLIDDLASELDQQSTQQVFEYLNNINSQIFITAINAEQVSPYIAAEKLAMFHVEHGQITADR